MKIEEIQMKLDMYQNLIMGAAGLSLIALLVFLYSGVQIATSQGDKMTIRKYKHRIALSIAIMMIAIILMAMFSDISSEKGNEMARKYIGDLKTEEVEVTSYDFNIGNNDAKKVLYIKEKETDKTKLKITYKKYGKEVSTYLNAVVKTTKKDKSYMTFKNLTETINDDYKKGLYDVVIYLENK